MLWPVGDYKDIKVPEPTLPRIDGAREPTTARSWNGSRPSAPASRRWRCRISTTRRRSPSRCSWATSPSDRDRPSTTTPKPARSPAARRPRSTSSPISARGGRSERCHSVERPQSASDLGDSLMRAFVGMVRGVDCREPALFHSRTLLAATSRSSRPRRPSEANPAVPGRRPFGARRGIQRRTTTRRLSDARHGQGPFPGHQQEARSASVHRPGSRAAPLLLLLRIRAIVSPGRQDRPRLCDGLLGHGDVEHQQRQACSGLSEGSPQAGDRSLARASRFISTPWSRFSKRARTPRPSGRTGCRASRRSSRSFPATLTLVPGWPW